MDAPLPPELAAALRPVLPELAEETIVAIGQEVPDYARPLEGPFGKALRAGVERALTRFVDELRGENAPAAVQYLLSSPSDGSACKRMNLFLRWMVRRRWLRRRS